MNNGPGCINGNAASIRLWAVVLFLLAFIACSPALNNDFVSYDDYKYTTENPFVKEGLTAASIKWALTALYFSNWHPVTWISHMADISLFGFDARRHHLTSLIVHALNAPLLFIALCSMTNARNTDAEAIPKCAFAAAFFAVHPLNVESVAWVAERKNCLSSFFWFFTLIAYTGYSQRRTLGRYLGVLGLFSLALMSKPMAVTLPFTLLLLDYWPLERFRAGHTVIDKYPITGLIAEKIPLFVLSFASSVITVYAQRQEGAIVALNQLPLSSRLSNAVMSYAGYIGKLFVPIRLAVFYPYIEEKSPATVALTALALVSVTVFVFIKRKTAQYLVVGWLWYIGTLVPVIQIVQVGAAPMADRYMYVPAVGLFIMISWGAADALSNLKTPVVARALGVAAIIALMFLSLRQTGYWRDSAALYKHAIKVTERNYLAHNNYGQLLMKQGRFDEAAEEFKKGLSIMPANCELNFNMWKVLSAKGAPDDKYLINARALWFHGDEAALLKKTGMTSFKRKNYDDAIEFLLKSLLINGKDAETFNYLGMAFQAKGQFKEASLTFNKALQLMPESAVLHFNMASALIMTGDNATAAEQLRQALRLDPSNSQAERLLAELEPANR